MDSLSPSIGEVLSFRMTDKREEVIRWRVEMRRERGAKQRLFLQVDGVYLAGKGAGERVPETPGRDIEAAMVTTILCAARSSEGKKESTWNTGRKAPTGYGGTASLHDEDYEHSIIGFSRAVWAERDGMDSIIGPYSGIVGSGWRK
jgi:hypothetical protein